MVERELQARAVLAFGQDENLEGAFLGTQQPVGDSLREKHEAVVADLPERALGDADGLGVLRLLESFCCRVWRLVAGCVF